jgi:hypothetical protein
MLLRAPLTASGSSILDSGGDPVRLAGVNWGGAQQNQCVPAGLDHLHRDAIAARAVRPARFRRVDYRRSPGSGVHAARSCR